MSKWPDDVVVTGEAVDLHAGKSVMVTLGSCEMFPGLTHDSVLRALQARTDYLLRRVESLDAKTSEPTQEDAMQNLYAALKLKQKCAQREANSHEGYAAGYSSEGSDERAGHCSDLARVHQEYADKFTELLCEIPDV